MSIPEMAGIKVRCLERSTYLLYYDASDYKITHLLTASDVQLEELAETRR